MACSQILMRCQLCELDTSIRWKCHDCVLLMCSNCKERIHPKFKRAKDHMITNIETLTLSETPVVSLKFSDVKCDQHAEQECCVFCGTCNQLICLKCITRIHNGHDFIEEEDYIAKRIKELKHEIDNFEDGINLSNETEEILAGIRCQEESHYSKMKQEITKHVTTLKQSIDTYGNELLVELDQNWNAVSQEIGQEEETVAEAKRKVMERKVDKEKVLKSGNIEDFLEDLTETESYNACIPDVDLSFNQVNEFLKGHFISSNFGILSERQASAENSNHYKFELKRKRRFQIDMKCIHYTAAYADDSIWMSDSCDDSFELKRVSLKGPYSKIMSRHRIKVRSLAATNTGDLLIAVEGSVLQKMNRNTGELADTIYSVAPLMCTTVHVTLDDKICVGAIDDGLSYPAQGKRVVIEFNNIGEQIAEFEYDDDGKPIFKHPKNITSTKGGNIFVVDFTSKSRDKVIVLGPVGNSMSIYLGHSELNDPSRPFTPRGIVTTTTDFVIITDKGSHALHILDCNGSMLSYVNTKTLNVVGPYSLSLSSNGNVFVGCVSRTTDPEDFQATLSEIEITY